MTFQAFGRRLLRAVLPAVALAALIPGTASAHLLTGRYESPLPLAAYLGGAAVAVGLSFAIVIFRSRARPAIAAPSGTAAGRVISVPRWLRLGLRALGLIAWLWIVIQGAVGGTNSDTDAGSLFLWTYGWVALPILSAFVGPVWEWLDPFATLHDLGAAALRRFGVGSWRVSAYPAALERWPAVAAMVVFVWLELVYTSARGGRVLSVAVLLYTAWTLLMMAQFGRNTWRRNGEAFTVWFGILNRLAALAPADEDGTTLRRRPFGAGLLDGTWLRTEVVFVAVATASILFDGLSQTQVWFDLFGLPSLPVATLLLLAFLSVITVVVLLVARVVGTRAMAAGLVPIALGYLIAHYFTALAFDGQRIVAVLSDPFNAGWNLFGTATFEPNETWLAFGIVWAIELIAVVGGHIYGAVMGHRAAVMDEPGPVTAPATPARDTGARTKTARARPKPARAIAPARSGMFADVRLRQVPLAVLMVALTTLTLWSLGQNLVHTAAEVASTLRGVLPA
jgi:hypothetical protein